MGFKIVTRYDVSGNFYKGNVGKVSGVKRVLECSQHAWHKDLFLEKAFLVNYSVGT